METVRYLLGLGLEPRELSVLQVCLRGIIVFIATIVIVRLGNRRFMARLTTFDAVLGFLLASVLARAINGSGPFIPTLAVGLVLALLHRLVAAVAFHWHGFSTLVKGQTDVLVVEGQVDQQRLRDLKISKHDLLEEVRLNGKVDAIEKVHIAILERNGTISVIPRLEGLRPAGEANSKS